MANDSNSSSSKSNFTIIFASIIVIFLAVTIAQVYLNKPAARAQVACYNLAVVHDIFWVTPVEIFAPNDVVWHLKQARDVQDTYKGCVSFLSRQEWLLMI